MTDDYELEEGEIEVIEVPMTEGDINELIEKLEELRETRGEVTYELDDENELLLKYCDDENEQDEEGDEEDDENEDEEEEDA